MDGRRAAKAEYRLMAARLPDAEVVTIRPGDAEAVAAGINPLEPALGPDGRPFSLQTHADLVRALFLAAFEAEEPFPQVLAAALTRCYERLGWDLALGEPLNTVAGGRGGRPPQGRRRGCRGRGGTSPRYPTLADLQATAEQVVDDIGYSQEITDNVRGFIRVRLSSLRLGTTGRFFEGGHPIDFDALLSRNVVLEIEDVGDDRDKAFLMGTVLVRLVEHLRLRQRRDASTGLRHLSVFEEAHRLLRRTEQAGAAAHAVETFASLLAEIRAYGEGLIVAEQIPSKLVPDVIKNTAVKIVHRLPAKDDRDAVGATMNITEAQSQFLVTLTPGEGAVFTDGMDFPHLVRMPDGSHLEKAVPTASPSVLVTPRSGTCGADCRDSPARSATCAPPSAPWRTVPSWWSGPSWRRPPTSPAGARRGRTRPFWTACRRGCATAPCPTPSTRPSRPAPPPPGWRTTSWTSCTATRARPTRRPTSRPPTAGASSWRSWSGRAGRRPAGDATLRAANGRTSTNAQSPATRSPNSSAP
ncbi:hypothetical protein [Actinomadura madurae]|uniref:hypothetical protein n=1 Tax=Actinomadura madurae TaxID=1993 RepID=UPI0020D1FD62|nr:hypothetical protein [Actinomadura madurae]MCQ0009928.1 hypothetical protein [Actinomadura madurae]